MNDQPIKEETSHKHLGIFFSNDGTWHEHIDYLTSKAWRRINIMRKLKFILDRQSLEIIYTSFIIPVLEYADVVWGNCTQYEINAIEKIQVEAARIATGATKLVSLDMLYQEIGWEPLEKRRYKHKLCLYRSMYYYRSFLPSSIRAWNDLALELRQSSSVQSFKYQLSKNLKRPPKYYYATTDYLRYDILD